MKVIFKNHICNGSIALHCLWNEPIHFPEGTPKTGLGLSNGLGLSQRFARSERFKSVFVQHRHLSSTKSPSPFEQGASALSLERLRYSINAQLCIRFRNERRHSPAAAVGMNVREFSWGVDFQSREANQQRSGLWQNCRIRPLEGRADGPSPASRAMPR